MNLKNTPKFEMSGERRATRFTVYPGRQMLIFISRERSWRWSTQVLAFTISCAFDDFRRLSETYSLYRRRRRRALQKLAVRPCI
jgi:hypothetical protein